MISQAKEFDSPLPDLRPARLSVTFTFLIQFSFIRLNSYYPDIFHLSRLLQPI